MGRGSAPAGAQVKKAAASVSSQLKFDKVKEGLAGVAPKARLFYTPLQPLSSLTS